MSSWWAIFLLSLYVSCRGHLYLGGEMNCDAVESVIGKNSFSMRSEHTAGEDTVTTYSIYEVIEDSEYLPMVDVDRSVTECVGKDIVHVKVLMKSKVKKNAVTLQTEPLQFYRPGAKNAVVSPDGKTVKRMSELDEVGFGGVLTTRELNDNELFEVTVEKLTYKWDDSVGIGVTHETPVSVDYPSWMSCGTIILYDHQLYEHGAVTLSNYGGNLKTLKVGDRVGVMKTSNGDLHFYINGEDQGIARSNVTYSVYGVVDVYGKAVEVSIVS